MDADKIKMQETCMQIVCDIYYKDMTTGQVLLYGAIVPIGQAQA